VDGAAGRNRTCDPLLRREMLYPLSYSRAAFQCINRIRGDAVHLEGLSFAYAERNAHDSSM
jgi:hypothetical protein